MRAIWVLLFLFPALALAQNVPQASGDAQGIHKLVSEFMEAWNRHDAHAFAETFAEDSDFTDVTLSRTFTRLDSPQDSRTHTKPPVT
jgi:hypothetical protein